MVEDVEAAAPLVGVRAVGAVAAREHLAVNLLAAAARKVAAILLRISGHGKSFSRAEVSRAAIPEGAKR